MNKDIDRMPMWLSRLCLSLSSEVVPEEIYYGRITAVVLLKRCGLTAERLHTITDGLTCTVALGEQRRRSCSLWPMRVGALSRCQRKQRPRNRQHTCQLCFPWSWQRWRRSGFWVKYLRSPSRTCVDCMFNRLSHFPAVHHLYWADVRSHFTVMAWANSVVKQNKQQFVRQPKNKTKQKRGACS